MAEIACFDIGGTYIKYGVIDEKGDIKDWGSHKTPKANCGEMIPLILIEHIKNMGKSHFIEGVGISTAGNVDSRKGEILFSSENLPEYTGTKLKDKVEAVFKFPCIVENDVNAAALGELWLGAGRNKNSFICLTLGTGIGGAIVLNGQLIRGKKNGAGEIGHMTIVEKGISCGCGSKGCYEQYASVNALMREYQRKSYNHKRISGEEIFQKVLEEDPIATKVYKEFVEHIVTGLVNITHLLDLGHIILGGGISESGEALLSDIKNSFYKRVMPSYREYTSIVIAELGNLAGLLGARSLFQM